MNENSFKKDLFDDQVYESKARKLGLLSKYSKQRILSYISVPVEYIVIVSITALILMIISYAVGVERGKNIAGKIDGNNENTKVILQTNSPEYFSSEINSENGKEKQKVDTEFSEENFYTSEDVVEEEIQNVLELEEDDILPEVSSYTVQLASFKNKEAAISETYKLKDKGINAEYVRKGDWYQVYAEGFLTIEEARVAQQMLAQYYRDCFIRKME